MLTANCQLLTSMINAQARTMPIPGQRQEVVGSFKLLSRLGRIASMVPPRCMKLRPRTRLPCMLSPCQSASCYMHLPAVCLPKHGRQRCVHQSNIARNRPRALLESENRSDPARPMMLLRCRADRRYVHCSCTKASL